MKKITAIFATLALSGCLLLIGCLPGVTVDNLDSCQVSAPRQASIPMGKARFVTIKAKAGKLTVESKTGQSQVDAQGTACAANANGLEKITLTAEVVGDSVVLEAQWPDHVTHAHLDLNVSIPAGMGAVVVDGAGATELRHITGSVSLDKDSGTVLASDVTGSVVLHQGSGDVQIDGMTGDLRLRQDSGITTVHNVTGDVLVESRGSGFSTISQVGQNVRIETLGSGSMDVHNVKGNLTVHNKGTATLHYTSIGGKVDLP